MWVPNFFIAQLLWMLGIVNYVREYEVPFFVWFTNNDEPDHLQNNYGDDNNRARWGITNIADRNVFVRWWWYFSWNVIRNSYFWFKLNVITPKIPKKGEPKIIKVKVNTLYPKNATYRENLHFCSYDDRGKIHVIEQRGNTLYFRYSFTKDIRFLSLKKLMVLWGKVPIWYPIIEDKIWNVQLGANDTEDIWGNTDNTNRYLFKSKITTLERINKGK